MVGEYTVAAPGNSSDTNHALIGFVFMIAVVAVVVVISRARKGGHAPSAKSIWQGIKRLVAGLIIVTGIIAAVIMGVGVVHWWQSQSHAAHVLELVGCGAAIIAAITGLVIWYRRVSG